MDNPSLRGGPIAESKCVDLYPKFGDQWAGVDRKVLAFINKYRAYNGLGELSLQTE